MKEMNNIEALKFQIKIINKKKSELLIRLQSNEYGFDEFIVQNSNLKKKAISSIINNITKQISVIRNSDE